MRVQASLDHHGSSGATECQAWRCQYELDKLQAAGYHIVRLECAQCT